MSALSMQVSEARMPAEHNPRDMESFSKLPPSWIFLDLLRSSNTSVLPAAVECKSVTKDDVQSRFKNNNFVLHSHLNPGYAHGVYPLASRFLNHSCTPNAVPRFVLREQHAPRMEIVALRDIAANEEVRSSESIQKLSRIHEDL